MKKEAEDSKIREIESIEKKQVIKTGVIILVILIGLITLAYFVVPAVKEALKTPVDQQTNDSTDYSRVDTDSCLENWNCTTWTECINNTKTRNCIDLNNCDTTEDKPATTQDCSNIAGNSCKEQFLLNETHQCDREIVQRKLQNSDCTTEWRTFTYCPVNNLCILNLSNPKKMCDLYLCKDLGGVTCTQNKTCENNVTSPARDSKACCLTTCLNATS